MGFKVDRIALDGKLIICGCNGLSIFLNLDGNAFVMNKSSFYFWFAVIYVLGQNRLQYFFLLGYKTSSFAFGI